MSGYITFPNIHRILTREIPLFNMVEVTGSTGSGYHNIINMTEKTFLFYNGTDKSGSFQLSGSRTESGDIEWKVGTAITLAPTTTDYTTYSDVIPFIQVYANYSVSPTSGSLGIWLFGRETR